MNCSHRRSTLKTRFARAIYLSNDHVSIIQITSVNNRSPQTVHNFYSSKFPSFGGDLYDFLQIATRMINRSIGIDRRREQSRASVRTFRLDVIPRCEATLSALQEPCPSGTRLSMRSGRSMTTRCQNRIKIVPSGQSVHLIVISSTEKNSSTSGGSIVFVLKRSLDGINLFLKTYIFTSKIN